jgi:hypothetical protein
MFPESESKDNAAFISKFPNIKLVQVVMNRPDAFTMSVRNQSIALERCLNSGINHFWSLDIAILSGKLHKS